MESPQPLATDSLPFIYDVVIVGAGPCGLAVAARLREHTPSALFTDEEHHRYHWINKHAVRASIKNSKTGTIRNSKDARVSSTTTTSAGPSMLVLDSSGNDWMVKWDRLFASLHISHLRSPMFFHPDPHDRDGLLAFAHSRGRECDCLEIAGCVGKEISKHRAKKRRRERNGNQRPAITIDERDRKDYFAPPSDLFKDYCRGIAQRYDIGGPKLIQQATVHDIDYDEIPQISPYEKLFKIRTGDGLVYARSVVMAVGAGNNPTPPEPFQRGDCPCACHAFQALNPRRTSKGWRKTTTNILVIGGGLTSAQVADQAIRDGAAKVWLVMRGPVKVKPFDVDLSWMGKFRNHEKASFWSADTDEERADLVKSARGGGSITPRYWRVLQQHIASGKLEVHTDTKVISQSYQPEDQTVFVETNPAIPDLPPFHHTFFATGVQSDFEKLDCLQTMNAKYPLRSYDGLPALTDDLMWAKDIPLFMTGKFAALRLGPGAGNLEGARTGAERIAWALDEILAGEEGRAFEEEHMNSEMNGDLDGLDQKLRYLSGIGSRFESLSIET